MGQRAENFRSPLRANRASYSRQPLLRRVARRAAFRDDQADRGHRSTAADSRRTLVRRAQTTSAGEMTRQMGAAVTCRPSARWMMRSKLRVALGAPCRGAQTRKRRTVRPRQIRCDARTNAVLVHNPLDMWPCAVDRDAVINYPRAATELALTLPRSALRSRQRRRGRGTR
jgi:hypothetical protein